MVALPTNETKRGSHTALAAATDRPQDTMLIVDDSRWCGGDDSVHRLARRHVTTVYDEQVAAVSSGGDNMIGSHANNQQSQCQWCQQLVWQ